MGQQFLTQFDQFDRGDDRGVEPVRCHGGKSLFSSPNRAIFSAIWRQIGPIIRHSRTL
ncbi:hypothetical protein PGB90_008608 [Kerria lacca]